MSRMRIAALDLGSNSFHLLVADTRPDGTITPVLRDKDMLRLGDVVAREGRIPPPHDDAAVGVVRRFRALAEAAGASELVACATSAMRDAANRDELLARFAAEAGVAVRVIDGDEEARLIFAAVRASVVLEPAPAVCLDLGGGSLEVMVGDATGLRAAVSLPLGVGRLTAELVRQDPPRRADLRRLRRRVTDVLGPVADAAAAHEPKMLVGTSGTLTDLAVIAATHRAGTAPTSVNQLEVGRDDLEATAELLLALRAAERGRVPGLDARRAPVVPAGTVLLSTAMELFGLDRLTIGAWALREGILLETLARHQPLTAPGDADAIRRAAVLDLCRRCGWPEAHSRHVARLALSLFDQTARLHGLGGADRELLELGALLHDVGEHISAEDHARHSAYLIEHARLRGFDPEDVAVLTCLGRHHARGAPKTDLGAYAVLPSRRRRSVRTLVALLQVAHGLDAGRTGAVHGLTAEVTPDAVRLVVAAATDGDLERWGAGRNARRFERALGRRLELVGGAPPTAIR